MPMLQANGVDLFHELSGQGEPLAFVHGSWSDSGSWAVMAPLLEGRFRTMRYDRRGHSASERPSSQGSVHEDADDLAALLEALDLAPAHLVCNSYGGNVALRLACKRPELVRSLALHEPPLLSLLAGDLDTAELMGRVGRSVQEVAEKLADGAHEEGARQFAEEVAFGPGAWDLIPAEVRDMMITNAPTFLDETRDPDQVVADVEALGRLERPVLLSDGDRSPPMFPAIVERLAAILPDVERRTLAGADHVPHLTQPEAYAEMLAGFALSPGAARAG